LIQRDTQLIVSLHMLLLILCFSFLAYVGGEVTDLSPIDDAYVSSLYPYVNRGSDSKLVLAWYQDFSGGYALDVKIPSYFKFDLSNIPSDAEIISAKLQLYAISVTVPSDIIVIYCPDNSWNEREITYSKAPRYDWRTPPISTRVSVANAWYSWELTSDVKNARGGQLTEVLQIDAYIVGQEPNHISFYSKEASDSSYRPRLTINYSKPVSWSFITCAVAAKTIQLGEKLEVTGAISPPHGGVSVSITYRSADGSTFTRSVLTSSDGTFSDSLTPQSSGEWSVSASWPGDEDHYASASEIISFTVKEKTPVPPVPFIGLWEITLILGPVVIVALLTVIGMARPRGMSRKYFVVGLLFVLIGLLGWPIVGLLGFVLEMVGVIVVIYSLMRSRRGAPPLARRGVKPITPTPSYVPKTPPTMPRMPLTSGEKKLPEVKITPAESLVPLDDKIYLYIVDHGGEISWSQASKELGVPIEELKASVERLKQARRIE